MPGASKRAHAAIVRGVFRLKSDARYDAARSDVRTCAALAARIACDVTCMAGGLQPHAGLAAAERT
ncbi:fumarate hydratase [Burkholderia thailandensis]|uniref:Uncharacterized protein n=1 Tax=Burkholderia thailandensis TaxID=57975 RepID=A0AAW9D1E2_BURTH|nr:fumarate hydratase [Burkholderia thailandensis]AOI51315.1 fumarate hydratase [Burkholderia thailandensis]AOJ50342.1 fumarate hydratase [Burkholderia thailandensis]AOJ57435.1 fumarate hydratase [Burkholderia thailandensis]AVR25751.1 fumarate hydratase [Burkholderia thailandensis]